MNRFTRVVGLGTLLIFGLGGFFLIEWVQGRSFITVVLAGWNIPLQLLTGLAAGLLSGGIALFIITRPFFKEQKRFYYKMIASRLRLNVPVILFLSLCAGIGEEIFFRAGMQPILGIWITSVIFVALHGYLNITNWRVGVYGITMLVIIAGFGYLFRYTGLFTAIMAHSAFDFLLFMHMYRSLKTRNNEVEVHEYQETDLTENPSSSQ